MIEAENTLRPLPQTDCLVEFGHSVAKGKEKWYLSRLLQPIEEQGIASDGFRRFVRTGTPETVAPDSPHAIVGGGVITTAATVETYKELADSGGAPKVVVHTGGRPGYLDKVAPDEPEVTEARVMGEVFTKKLRAKRLTPEPKQEVVEAGVNTEADIRNGLEAALKHGCTSVTFIGLRVRLDRCKAFYEKIMSETDTYSALTVTFLPAEDVMRRVAATRGRSAQLDTVLTNFYASEGYKRTEEAEQGGIMALRVGTYGQSTGGKGKT